MTTKTQLGAIRYGTISKIRLVLAQLLILFVFSWGVFDWTFVREDFPFSSYSMYARLEDNSNYWRICAIDENGQEHPRFYLGPFYTVQILKILRKDRREGTNKAAELLSELTHKFSWFSDPQQNNAKLALKGFRIFEVQNNIPKLVFEVTKGG